MALHPCDKYSGGPGVKPPAACQRHTAPMKVLAVVGIILLGKTVAAVALVLAFRYPLNTALTVGASLAQIGEFSFILAGLGVSLGLLPAEVPAALPPALPGS